MNRAAPWKGVAVIAAVLCTVADLVILQRRFGIFSIGFLTSYRVSGLGIPYFVLGSLLMDAAAAALLAWPTLWLTRRLRPARQLVAASLLSALTILSITVARFDIARFVGDTWQFRFAPDTTIDTELLGLGLFAAVALAGFLTAVWVARFLPPRITHVLCTGSRTGRRAALGVSGVVVGAVVFVWITGVLSVGMQQKMQRKTSARLLVDAANLATDFDLDGFGLVSVPRDAAPFDGRIHPGAIDWPDNGIDENSIGGDLRMRGTFALEQFAPVRFEQKPDVVVIVLESFRADNITAEVNGKPVAPVLRRLIKEGAITGPAYSHNGFTVESLAHLFTGSLTLTVASSMVDDFNENGYMTACVSGQDESFGGIKEKTGLTRVGSFRDASDDRAERSYPFTTPGSLTVPSAVVVRNMRALLHRNKGTATPLFAYVNLQDCHYPYVPKGLKPLLSDDPIPRSEISAENADWVERTYRNTAANVDHAIGEILDAWEQKRGKRPAFLILADHGESFYSNQVLGHGVKITRLQTQIAFVAGGFQTEFVFPMGLRHVRRLIRDALTIAPADAHPASATIDADKWVFQYIGTLRRPIYVGGATATGGRVIHLARDRAHHWGEESKLPDLARFWEQIALYRAENKPR